MCDVLNVYNLVSSVVHIYDLCLVLQVSYFTRLRAECVFELL